MSVDYPRGFLFEIRDSGNQLKGYLFGVDHKADKASLLSLQNRKIQNAFRSAQVVFFENEKRYLEDIDRCSEQKGQTCFAANVKRLVESGSDFSRLTQFSGGPLDSELGITKPGVDFQLLAQSYEENKPVDSLEELAASDQSQVTQDIVQASFKNLKAFLNPELYEKLLRTSAHTSEINEAPIEQLVTRRNDAWRNGNVDEFIAVMHCLDSGIFLEALQLLDKVVMQFPTAPENMELYGFLIKEKNLPQELLEYTGLFDEAVRDADKNAEKDWIGYVRGYIVENPAFHGNKELAESAFKLFELMDICKMIAFQRNREVELVKRVDTMLRTMNKLQFYVLGTNHLVSSHNLTTLSLLKEKGWKIGQVL